MNRSLIHSSFLCERHISVDSKEHKEQVDKWTAKLLSKTPCVSSGCNFTWSREGQTGSSTAYLFDAIMTNVQYAQNQLMRSSLSAGKQAYKCAIDAAHSYAFVLQTLLPQWTFSHTVDIPDCQPHDVYGHYCLARAMAYDSVGKADLQCSDAAKLASAGNAAHMYAMAAQLITGNCSSMIKKAEISVADALCIYGEQCLRQWDNEKDDSGAAKALGCFQEADRRYNYAGVEGCADKIKFAYERNQVHWLEPILPPFEMIIPPRITPLHH